MIIKNNFSGDADACLKMGKANFIKAHKGIYNGDLNELWAEIEKGAKPSTKKPKK
jgi:hypothetical protein